jgi:hypothetical protein
MRSLSRRRPSHATVVAYLALFVALGGTAVAAKIQSNEIAKNAVKTKKIADAAVTNPKIANFAVNSSKLADDAVTESKLAQDSVSGNKIQQAVIGTGKLREAAVENSKIADGAVTGPKVADGSLGLSDVAQVVANLSFDPLNVSAGACANSGSISVPGLQDGDDVLVIPRGIADGWDDNFYLGPYGPTGGGTIRIQVCNHGSVNDDPAPLPITVLGFR